MIATLSNGREYRGVGFVSNEGQCKWFPISHKIMMTEKEFKKHFNSGYLARIRAIKESPDHNTWWDILPRFQSLCGDSQYVWSPDMGKVIHTVYICKNGVKQIQFYSERGFAL